MKVLSNLFAIVAIIILSNSLASAQSKEVKKASKNAAKVMCKCTAIRDMAVTIETYQKNPNLVVTEEVSNQVKGYIQKSTICLDKFEQYKQTVEPSELQFFNDLVEENMTKTCPDILQVINAFAELEE